MILELIGIRFVNPLTQFGLLSPLVLISSIIIITSFFAAGIFIYIYYKRLYEVGEVPKGWSYFLLGLVLNGLYQFLKVPFTYGWIYGNIYLIGFLIFQVVVTIIFAYGLYLLKRGVESK